MMMSNSYSKQIGITLFSSPFNYEVILSSCESAINTFSAYYTACQDDKDDLAQELRIKVWNALENRYDESRGDVYSFAFGVIRLEAKKHVLDAHKYRQRYFENNMDAFIESQFSTSDPFGDEFDNFASSFSLGLTPRQRSVFNSIIEAVDSNQNVFYDYSGKVKSKYVIKGYSGSDKECMRHFSHIKRKLFEFAKERHFMMCLSTTEARLQ